MSFTYPLYLWLAGAAALAVVGLHYLTTMQQRPEAFPTTRFIPEQQVRHSTVSPRFSDLLLMLLRIIALMLLGIALAQPRVAVGRSPVARIVLVDHSQSVRRDAAWMKQVENETRDASAVIPFDSTRQVGRISPALIEGLRAANRVRDRADSIELVLVAPMVTGSVDQGTLAIRAQWPGGIRLVRASLADWPASGTVKVEWADSAASSHWAAAPSIDTVLGVQADDATLIARFARRWSLRSGDSAMVIGRWIDGAPAMVEQVTGTGCTRSIGFALPSEGDAVFRPEFDRFRSALRAPCRHTRRPEALPASVQQAISGPGGMIGSAQITDVAPRMVAITPWLLLLVVLLFAGELWMRRGKTEASA